MTCVKNISKCLLFVGCCHIEALMNRVLSYYFNEKEKKPHTMQ